MSTTETVKTLNTPTLETEQSPLPWTIFDQGHLFIDDADGHPVAIIEKRDGFASNAELIVRAVNSHEALVEALEELLAADQAYCDAIDTGGHEEAHANRLIKARQMARTALTSLEVKQ